MYKSDGLLKPTILVTSCSVIGIAVSFISQLVIAYFFGAKFERDAYFVAIAIPTYISAIFVGSIGIIFLPKIIDIFKDNQNDGINFLSSIFWIVTILLITISIIGIFFSSSIIRIISHGYNSQQNIFASKILIITLPTILFGVLSNLLSSIYQIQNKFLRPALSSIITSIVSLFFVFILNKSIGIFSLAVGFLIGSILSFAFLLPILKTIKLRLYLNLKSSEVQSFFRTLFPLFLTGILFRSTNLFERMIASELPVGSVSYLGYSGQIIGILATLTTSGIAVSFYPSLSQMWSKNKINELVSFFNKIFRIILLISIPIIVVIIFFGDSLVKFVLERGAFTSEVTLAVGRALTWSMGAFLFQNLGSVVSKIFYVAGKTTIISIIASLELIIYISLGFFLSKYISFIGLSIALSISSMFNILFSLMLINKKIFKIDFNFLISDFLKIFSISGISFIPVYYLSHILKIENNFYLVFLLITGMIIYFLLGIAFKINEVLYFTSKLLILTSKLKSFISNGRN